MTAIAKIKTERFEDGTVFRDDVQCFVTTLAYDFKTRTGTLHLEEGSCTDMHGCIELFKRIDSSVVRIQSLAGGNGRRDTEYRLEDGGWQSFNRAVSD